MKETYIGTSSGEASPPKEGAPQQCTGSVALVDCHQKRAILLTPV